MERYDRLIAQHGSLVIRLCKIYALGDKNRSAELRQDCYMSLWNYLPSLIEDATPAQEAAWVTWHCKSVFSRSRYHRKSIKMLPLDEGMAGTMAESDDTAPSDAIEALAGLLTPGEQKAFFLMAEGYTAEELSQVLGIKHRSAVLLRHRIIKKLRIKVHSNHEKEEDDR